MSTTPRKPSGTNGTTGPSSRTTPDRTTATSAENRTATTKSSNGLQRTPSGRGSPVSARAAARKPGRSNLSVSSVPKIAASDSSSFDDEARAQNAALIDELKEQLQKSETASEQYQKQLSVLQSRLDDAVSEQQKLEDQAHERDSHIEALNAQIREHARQLRDMEQAHEQERNAMLRDKEQQISREDELQSTIQRLKESIAQKDIRINTDADKANISRSSSFRNRSSPDVDNGQFAPSAQIERSPSRNNAKLLLQKDRLIESLRLELAESQIKLVEMENKGGGLQQELERELLEARMANARLMEDNESYQLLLSEKTLNGDFSKGDFLHETPSTLPHSVSGSLADELESVGEGNNAETRKLEAELKTLKDQNKALTLYIERIIGRLLQHEGFEHILDKNDGPLAGATTSKTDKELPPPPPEKDEPSLLQRAKSVIMPGQTGRPQPQPQPKSRPVSMMPPPTSVPSAHENPDTAPSIPLGRSQSVRTGHRRSRSDQIGDPAMAAAVVGQMYRGPSGSRSPSGVPLSPTTMGPGSRQSGFFGSYMSSSNARAPSQSSQPDRKRLSSSDSVSSDVNAEVSSLGATSTPPSRSSSSMNNYTGAVMTQNRLRPLRLVRENQEPSEEDEAANKRANRASWMGWFNRPTSNPMQEEAPKQ